MVRLTALGGLDLRDAEGSELAAVLRQPKRVVLLAYLAIVGRARYVRRDELVAFFWPELDNEHARSALRTALSRLRSGLRKDPFLTRGAEELRINPDVLWCDAAAFLGAHEQGNLDEALALYRGDLLEGVYASVVTHDLEHWIDNERGRLRRLAARASWLVAEREEAANRLSSAIAAARKGLTLTPYDEPGLRRLMSLFMRAGDRAAALDVYSDFSRRLARELDAVPTEVTHAAMLGIRGEAAPQPRGFEAAVAVPPVVVRERTARARRPRRAYFALSTAAVLLLVGIWPLRRAIDAGAMNILPSGTTLGPAEWQRLATSNDPLPRYHHRVILDRSGNSAVMFGGRAGFNLLGDLWRLTGLVAGPATWTRLYPMEGVAPQPRWLHVMVYASPTDRMILFGGALGHAWPCANDVWHLNGVSTDRVAWRQLQVPGEQPLPRAEMAAAYDAASNRLIVFGGHDCVAKRFNEVWLLLSADGTNGKPRWQPVLPRAPRGSPGPRSALSVVYDPVTNRLIVFGGSDGEHLYDDVWILLNANGTGGELEWVPLKVEGARPMPRSHHVSAFDPTTNSMVVFGGSTRLSNRTSETWTLRGANGATGSGTWRQTVFADSGPARRYEHAAAFDVMRQRLFVFGGVGDSQEMVLRDVWLLRGATK